MGENTSRLEHEIRTERAELGRNLEDLEQKAKDLADWRVHYGRHPEVFLGLAAGAGLIAGVLASTGGSTAEAPVTAYPRESREHRPLLERSRKAAHLVETWGHISDALLGLATAKIVDSIADALPGFRDQYDNRVGSPVSR